MESLWQYSTVYNSPCQIIEEQTLWGQTVCRIWLPNQNAVVRVSKSTILPLNHALQPELESGRIRYVAAAAKVAEILETSGSPSEGQVLLSPMESNVIPLPHQLQVLSRAISSDKIRYLLADEVGLGKTVEAGLIMRELKLRGMVCRTLVVAPKSIAPQWVTEMNSHFSESFTLVNAVDLEAFERLDRPFLPENDTPEYNPWINFPQTVITTDAFKPLARRRGWSKETVLAYNLSRYEKLINGQWDLIIVDEAHHFGGCSDSVARYKLGQGLAEAAPYLLLLSATPHQGKTDAFARLMGLLDPMNFPDEESITREKVTDFVIRTEKRKAITAEGKPLFKPRTTRTHAINLSSHPQQALLYDEVTEYAKHGYNLALKNRMPHIGFLMVLFQRIVTSSTHAVRCMLERRLEVLENLADTPGSGINRIIEDLEELTGQELLDALVEVHEPGRVNEVQQVQFLLDLAKQAEAAGPDVKTSELLGLIYELQGEEKDDQVKILIFTEFLATQEMLQTFFEARGITCATINGSMSMEDRLVSQKKFRDNARIMISTDAGGEGLNLQFCHIVINYDLPWNPMRIEQRIGRVDRIGQTRDVRAINFVYQDSIESRVREVLESKLAIIHDQMGIDKTGDILDTSLSGEMIEKMITHVLMEDGDPDTEVTDTVNRLQNERASLRETCPVYAISNDPDLAMADSLRSHPLPYWVERMTVGYLDSHGGIAEHKVSWWNLTWPDGMKQHKCVFNSRDADRLTDATLVSLEESRVRGLALNLPGLVMGQPLPCVSLEGLPDSIVGLWGLFEIRLRAGGLQSMEFIRIPMVRRGYVSVFINDQGKVFLPTARHIWEQIQSVEPTIEGMLDAEESLIAHKILHKAAEEAGQELYSALRHAHSASIAREEERARVAFGSQRKAIMRVGLPEVRHYRMNRCDEEEATWRRELAIAKEIVPEMRPLISMRVEKGKKEVLS